MQINKYVITLLLLASLFTILPMASADGELPEIRFVAEIDMPFDILEECLNNGTYCSGAALCNVSVKSPDGSLLIDNKVMINQISVHNFSVNASDNERLGQHEVTTICADNGRQNFGKFFYLVTANGETVSLAKSIFYALGFIVILGLFIFSVFGFVQSEGFLGKGSFGLFSYLFLLVITFLGWNVANDFVTSAPFLIEFLRIMFIVLMVGFFPLILATFAWLGYMSVTHQDIVKLIEKGVPEEEAERRVRRRR